MPFRKPENMAQNEVEIARFADILRENNVQSYLEIGSKFGGSLWRAATALPPGSRIVSVDLPRGTKLWNQSESSLKCCMIELSRRGYDTHLIWGDSTDEKIILQVKKLGPFDACFLDGNHTLPFLEKDVTNYGPMTKILSFHDIAWRRAPEWKEGTRIDVGLWWEAHKAEYPRYEEIKFCPTGKNNGIGVLWL